MQFDENPQEQFNLREPDSQSDNNHLDNNGVSDVSSLVKQEHRPSTPAGLQKDNMQEGEAINDAMLATLGEGLV